jgi:hypothetical protein
MQFHLADPRGDAAAGQRFTLLQATLARFATLGATGGGLLGGPDQRIAGQMFFEKERRHLLGDHRHHVFPFRECDQLLLALRAEHPLERRIRALPPPLSQRTQRAVHGSSSQS